MHDDWPHEDGPQPSAAADADQTGEGRGGQRRLAFLNAARDVFLEHGYESASMAEIVRRAGGSLATLYAQFGGKQGLFLAMFEDRVGEMTRQMQLEQQSQTPLTEGLQRIGETFLTKIVDPEALDVWRLLTGLARKFPELPAGYMRLGPDKVRAALADYLSDRAAAGEVTLADPARAAGVFIDLVRLRIHTRCLLEPSYRPTPEEITEQTARAVRIFLRAAEEI